MKEIGAIFVVSISGICTVQLAAIVKIGRIQNISGSLSTAYNSHGAGKSYDGTSPERTERRPSSRR